MRCVSYDIELVSGNMIYIEPLGDMHIGSLGFDEQKLLSRIEVIKKDRNRYWIGMGDYIDAISPWKKGYIDKRFDEAVYRSDYPTISRQIEKFISLVKPISRKCLGLLWGNHEWDKMEQEDFVRDFCSPLGVPFLGSRCFVNLNIKKKGRLLGNWWIFAIHGKWGGERKGGAINKFDLLPRFIDADIYLMAHTHIKAVMPESRIVPVFRDGKVEIVEKDLIFAFTGGFLKQYVIGEDTYMDKAGFPKNFRTGTITVGIDPERGKLHGFD